MGNQRVVEYGAIPVEITHPGTECVADQDVYRDPLRPRRQRPAPATCPGGSRCSPRCSCTAACCTWRATCCSCGSSETTSRTPWRGWRSSPSTYWAGWPRSALQVLDGPELGGADRRRERGDSRGARRIRAAVSACAGGHAGLHRDHLHRGHIARAARIGGVVPAAAPAGLQRARRRGGGGGVAYFAHIGGFLFGLLAIKLFANNVREDYDRALPYSRVLMARTLVLGGTLAIICLLAFLTISVAVEGRDRRPRGRLGDRAGAARHGRAGRPVRRRRPMARRGRTSGLRRSPAPSCTAAAAARAPAG